MQNQDFSRRKFIKAAAITTAAAGLGVTPGMSGAKETLAVLGGSAVRQGRIGPSWPYIDDKVIESVLKTVKSGVWSRIQSATGTVPTFEQHFAKLVGAPYCVGTGSGTQALSTCVEAMNLGPGDEVITSPYTDFGTISAILTSRALPVLVDVDPLSFQLDPGEVEKHINANTRAIMPVHIMGLPANMERIMAIAKKHNLKVIEDACQAPFSRYQGKAVGLIGDLGTFSFQASKAIACGEGGAVVGSDEKLMNECFTVQNRGASKQGKNERIGPKYRMNEFEGAVLLGQLDGAKERFEIRNANANYLASKLKDFPGLKPQKQYEGTESGAYYNFAMSYDKEFFNGADRAKFLKAINAEGVPFTSYIKNGLHREPWVDNIIRLKAYTKFFSPQRLKSYKEGMQLKNTDLITDQTMVVMWGSGTLLAERSELDKIVDAIHKVHENRDKLKTI
ncbi:DegT/DnrJ/EryC1/StrS family aminotransferase [Ravibacter arvi]|uniref:DegT/DnrJ/EryC1/StrS family aminotransferase n=1 Tax=Ravibacter arvi TaxID=2051041 RepID=A0ABP8LYT8_9BACT